MTMTDDKYVTYKWLIATGLSTLAICITISIFTYKLVLDRIELKTDLSKTTAMCDDIAEIKQQSINNGNNISDIKVAIGKLEVMLKQFNNKQR